MTYTITPYYGGYYQEVRSEVTYDVAAYWSNGVRIDLTDGVEVTDSARITGMYVDGNDVYACGYVSTSGVKSAVYWKNEVQTALPASTAAEATDIFVSGEDVYVSGRRNSATAAKFPVYWKNSTIVDLLATEAMNANATGIIVDSGLILVSGHYDNGTTVFTATLWRHDGTNAVEETDLSEGANSEGWGLTVGSGGDYLVSGSFFNGTSFASAYWAVDSSTFATTKTELYNVAEDGIWSKAFGIDELAGTAYNVGYFTSSGEKPTLWVGTTQTELDENEMVGRAQGIATSTLITAVGGYLQTSVVDQKIATAWENEVRITLYDSTNADLDAEVLTVFGLVEEIPVDEAALIEDVPDEHFQPYRTMSFRKTFVCAKCDHHFKEGEGSLIGGVPYCKRFGCLTEERLDRRRRR